jgi:hypothetical protein
MCRQLPPEQWGHPVVQLVVCERVHGVDEKRADAGSLWSWVLQKCVGNRVEKGLCLAAPGPRCCKKALFVHHGPTNRILLVDMQRPVRCRKAPERVVKKASSGNRHFGERTSLLKIWQSLDIRALYKALLVQQVPELSGECGYRREIGRVVAMYRDRTRDKSSEKTIGLVSDTLYPLIKFHCLDKFPKK